MRRLAGNSAEGSAWSFAAKPHSEGWCGPWREIGGTGHAVNTSLYARLGHPWPRTVPSRQSPSRAIKSAARFRLEKHRTASTPLPPLLLVVHSCLLHFPESGTWFIACGVLPVHGTVRGRDAARERTGTYSQRVP